MSLLAAVSAPGREGRVNEDGYGTAGRFAWVIDGATGLSETPLLDAPSDAAWLTGALHAALEAGAAEAGDARGLLARAAGVCTERFAVERLREPSERYEMPTAAVLVAEFNGESVEIVELGDCGIFLASPRGMVRFGGTAVGKSLEQENAARMMAEGSGRTPEVLAFLREVRNKANTPEGYAIFAPEPGCLDGARRHRHMAEAGKALLVSDGYEAASEDYGLYDARSLVGAAFADINGPLDALRDVEAADPSCTRFPRFKQSDDATALVVRFGPVQAG